MDLTDKLAVVTGGSSGIGLAIARSLAQRGVHTALFARDPDRLKAAAEGLVSDYPITARGYSVDVTDVHKIRKGFAQVAQDFGREHVDIIVDNAGVMALGAFVSDDPEFQEMQRDAMYTNAYGPLLFWQEALPYMRRSQQTAEQSVGLVVSSKSVLDFPDSEHPSGFLPGNTVYGSAKAAQYLTTLGIAHENPDLRFRWIMPGLVATAGIDGKGMTPDTAAFVETAPKLTPEEVGEHAVQLIDGNHPGPALYVGKTENGLETENLGHMQVRFPRK